MDQAAETIAVLALINSDHKGFDALYKAYHTPLTCFATRQVNDHQLAQDIVAETFTRLWIRREQLSGQGSIKSWLFTSVRNLAVDHLRRLKLQRRHLSQMGSAAAVQPSLLNQIIHAETLRLVQQAAASLPTRCGQVFSMHFFEELPCQEIAKSLNSSVHTVRNQRSASLRMIKERF